MDEKTFRERLEADGYGEVLVRDVDAAYGLDVHDHPFDARLLMLAGEMTIGMPDGTATTYRPGDVCDLPRGMGHTESYSSGAKIVIGRRR